MPETTPLIKAALNLRVGAGFDVYLSPPICFEHCVQLYFYLTTNLSKFHINIKNKLQNTRQKSRRSVVYSLCISIAHVHPPGCTHNCHSSRRYRCWSSGCNHCWHIHNRPEFRRSPVPRQTHCRRTGTSHCVPRHRKG